MKNPASFHTATTMTQNSAVSGLPSQFCEAKPNRPEICSSNPYCGVKKNSQILATAIIGSTVGVKKAVRRKDRPASRSLTHTAMRIARPIDSGMVPSANITLLDSDCQNTGSSNMAL